MDMHIPLSSTPTIIDLPQGSQAWLDYRLTMRNASETAAVLGVSPWCTPYQLWLLKTGRAQTKANAAMLRGTGLEPVARLAYELETGTIVQPLVLQDDLVTKARDELVALARHPKEQGAGVSVTRFWKAGAVNYKAVPELKGVNLEKYRGTLREEVRVTAA